MLVLKRLGKLAIDITIVENSITKSFCKSQKKNFIKDITRLYCPCPTKNNIC